MELIERAGFLKLLHTEFQTIASGEGRCVFVSGEPGIGKTSLVKTFCTEVKHKCNIYQGTCDALFTPRPLAPLYDIILQISNELPAGNADMADRTTLFTRFFLELKKLDAPFVIVFEDIHWADEATLDFIKFLARRISQLRCLFILTYRDNEVHPRHPVRNVVGQLNPDSFLLMQLLPLSREAVDKLAEDRGYNGEDVYTISAGNPFYVTEILASYSTGVPDNIKDSILSVYALLDEKTKKVWEILSVMPIAFPVSYLEKLEPAYADAIGNCLEKSVLIIDNNLIFFKHELYRRTIESSLSPLLRIALNKKILDMFKDSFEQNHQVEQIIHHAKNANDYDLVIQYSPIAAEQAASVGAHIEASRLYFTAIEYYQGNDPAILLRFYEAYAYECYLTNQVNEAIIYTGKALTLWKNKNDNEKVGNSMRFLSRLWWFKGNGKKAENFATMAIDVLENQPSSRAKAMAYSNMSQLKMLGDNADESINWAEKAMIIAKEIDDRETLAHALNNIGSVKMKLQPSSHEGAALLQESLAIALQYSYHEHAARAYTNLASNWFALKQYKPAKNILDSGIAYCEERDMDSWTSYLQCSKGLLHLETGNWKEAYDIADNLLKNETPPPVIRIGASLLGGIIKMRRGDEDALALLLDAKENAFETLELQNIIPSLTALLEYEWITGSQLVDTTSLDGTIRIIDQRENVFEKNEFAFWLKKARKQILPLRKIHNAYRLATPLLAQKAAAWWEETGSPYMQAMCLFEGNEDDKRNAISIIDGLGASAVYEKMKLEMRSSGIKSIPRGLRKTTRLNPAFLTDRELDVLQLLNEGMQNKEIAAKLFISSKTVDHHISSILYKLEVKTRIKAVQEAIRLEIIK